MDKITKLFYKAANELHLPCTFIPEIQALKIVLGQKNYYFYYTLTPLNNAVSSNIAGNKYTFNRLMKKYGASVPNAIIISYEDWSCKPLNELIKGMIFPLVAKPMTLGGRGRDVLCNIKNLDVLNDYCSRMVGKYQFIQIEEFLPNFREYRVLILKNKVLGVVERFSASVIGDGIHTVEELIAQKNKQREILSEEMTHSPLVYDEEYKLCLEEQGLSLQSVIPQDKKIRLCYTINLGRGGDICSLGKKIHPYNKRILCQLMKKMNLTYAGLDVLCENIEVAFKQNNWFLIEANTYPDVTMHEVPQKGKRVPVVKAVLAELIYSHPFSYLYHICTKSVLSMYIKILIILFLILFIKFLS